MVRPLGDVQQLHRPIPEEVRPQHDSAVTKPLESLRPVMYSEPKKKAPTPLQVEAKCRAASTSAASSGRGRYSWSFFSAETSEYLDRISRFAFAQFDLTQNSLPKVSQRAGQPGRSVQSAFLRLCGRGGQPSAYIICDESTPSRHRSSGRTKCRMRCNRELPWHRPSPVAARSYLYFAITTFSLRDCADHIVVTFRHAKLIASFSAGLRIHSLRL